MNVMKTLNKELAEATVKEGINTHGNVNDYYYWKGRRQALEIAIEIVEEGAK